MKNLIRIPENKEELKALWAEDKKKIIGGAVAVGAFIAGAVFAHDKLKANDEASDCDDTAGYLTEGDGDDEDYQGDPDDEEETEDENENEADAE